MTSLLSQSSRRRVQQPGPWVLWSAHSHQGWGAWPMRLDLRACHRPPTNHKSMGLPAWQTSFKTTAARGPGLLVLQGKAKVLAGLEERCINCMLLWGLRGRAKKKFPLIALMFLCTIPRCESSPSTPNSEWRLKFYPRAANVFIFLNGAQRTAFGTAVQSV